MASERDAQRAYDNRQEPEERNWREVVGPRPEPLDGEDLYDECMEELKRRRWEK